MLLGCSGVWRTMGRRCLCLCLQLHVCLCSNECEWEDRRRQGCPQPSWIACILERKSFMCVALWIWQHGAVPRTCLLQVQLFNQGLSQVSQPMDDGESGPGILLCSPSMTLPVQQKVPPQEERAEIY